MLHKSREASYVIVPDGYLKRHLERREKERELEVGLCFDEPQPLQSDFIPASGWIGIMNSWMRPKGKEFGWKIG
jgi:hypothetical protein